IANLARGGMKADALVWRLALGGEETTDTHGCPPHWRLDKGVALRESRLKEPRVPRGYRPLSCQTSVCEAQRRMRTLNPDSGQRKRYCVNAGMEPLDVVG